MHLLELAARARAAPDASSGAWQWAREECEPLALVSDERDPETIFARLPRVGGLSAAARPVARELVEWRERTAARQNRPVQSVLSDATLVEIAKRRPSSRGELEKIRGVGGGGSTRRAGEELLEAVRRGRERPADPAPHDAAPARAEARRRAAGRARRGAAARPRARSRARLRAAGRARRPAGDRRRRARRRGEADVRTLRGWRRELVGAELLELLDGARLAVGARQRPRPARAGRRAADA